MPTARPFAYNPGSPIAGTEQVGDIAVGITPQNYSGGYGGVRWWNGPDEELGYIICYSVPTEDHPSPDGPIAGVGFFRSKFLTEPSFVEIAEYVAAGSQSFGNGAEAKAWLNNNGYWTSFPPTPANLLVYLDSSNPLSYPGVGDTWFDLSGNNNDATLLNSPTFSSSFSGVIEFDDTSLQYATIPDIGNLSAWTVESWFRLSSPLTSKVTAVVTNEFDLIDKLNFSLGTNNAPTNNNLAAGFFDGTWRTTAGFVPQVGQWYQVVGTYDGSTVRQYINGSASGGTLNYTGTPESGGEIRLMRRWDLALQASNLVDGDLGFVKIYDSAISAAEVQESFDENYLRFRACKQYRINWANLSGTFVGVANWIDCFDTPQTFSQLIIGGGTLARYVCAKELTVTASGASFNQITDLGECVAPGPTPTLPAFTTTPTPTPSVSPTATPQPTTTPTVSPTPTLTPEPTTTPTPTQTTSVTPTLTPTPSSTPSVALTGYSYNLQCSPAQMQNGDVFLFSSAGNITYNPNDILPNGIVAFNTIDTDGMDRTSYYSPITGNTTLTLFQGSNVAVFDVSEGAFTYLTQPGANFFYFDGSVTPGLVTQTTLSSGSFTCGEPIFISISSPPTPPSSGFTATVQQVGLDVIWSGSGTFDLTDLTIQTSSTLGAGYAANQAIWAAGPTTPVSVEQYGGASFTTYPTTFDSGTGSSVAASSGSGDLFGILPGTPFRVVVVPAGYTSGNFISGITTYENTTISAMGLSGGTYTWEWGTSPNTSTLTLQIIP